MTNRQIKRRLNLDAVLLYHCLVDGFRTSDRGYLTNCLVKRNHMNQHILTLARHFSIYSDRLWLYKHWLTQCPFPIRVL